MIQEGNPIREFGEQLQAKGYSYHGGETMISGVTGEEFQVFSCSFFLRTLAP